MRVALITQEFPPAIDGGAGTYAGELSAELVDLGVDLTVFTVAEACERSGPMRVVPVSPRSAGALGFWLRLPLALRSESARSGPFELLHSNGVAATWLGLGGPSVPLVATIHHVTRQLIGRGLVGFATRLRDLRGESGIVPYLERRIVKGADRLIAVSSLTARDLYRYYRIAMERVCVVPLGVRLPARMDPSAVSELRSQVCAEGQLLLTSVGRLEARKGTDVLLRALALVRRTTGVRLVLAGGEAGPYRRLASMLGISDAVVFLPRLSDQDLHALYEACDMYVSASRLEGFGLAPMEAMAHGKPVVVTETGLAAGGFLPRDIGAIVPPDDPRALADAITRLAANPSGLRAIGERNRAWVERHLSWRRTAEDTLQVYEGVLSMFGTKGGT